MLDWDGVEDDDCRISHESESSESSFGGDDGIANELEMNGDNPAHHLKTQRQVVGPEFSFSMSSILDVPGLVGRPLTNHKMTPLETVGARSPSEKQTKFSSFDLPKKLVSGERKEDFSSRAYISQETKLKINSEGLNGCEGGSPGRSASISGKPSHVRETVIAADNVYLERAECQIKRPASQTHQEVFNDSETSTNGELKPKIVNNGEKLVRGYPVMNMAKSTFEKEIKPGKGFFRSDGGENQAFSALNGCNTAWKSTPLQNKVRRNEETLVSAMTVACSDDRHLPPESYKSWRKPLIDQIFITDVTSNFVTVTVKECLTDKGFFRQR